MREALVRYGKVEASTPSALVAAHLSGALKWGTAPKVMVMSREMFVGGSESGDWLGTYDPKRKVITLCKSLVTQWQKTPDDKILRRSMITVMLHELVHFLNHEVQPATTIHSEPGHLKGTFHKEAFEPPPLSWEMAHYMVDQGSPEDQGRRVAIASAGRFSPAWPRSLPRQPCRARKSSTAALCLRSPTAFM